MGEKVRAIVARVLVLLLTMSAAGGIAESADAPPPIRVDQAHLFIEPGGARVRITEHYLVGNAGDRPYEGGVRFELPPGARDLAFDGPGLGERFAPHEGGGFTDTRPIPPGGATVEVGFNYELAYSPEMQISRALPVPVASVVLLVSGDSVGLAGPGLTPAGRLDTPRGPATAYVAGPLAAGEVLAFTLRPLDGPEAVSGAALRRRAPIRELGLGIAALALAALVSFWLWHPDVPPPPEAARPLIAQIARLDREAEAGALDEAAWRQQRAALKAHLLRMLQDPPGAATERPTDESPTPPERTSDAA